MKTIMISIMTALLFVGAQAQVFDGVEVKGKAADVAAKFKDKGYVLVEYKSNAYLFTGKVMGSPVEVWLIESPVTKVAAKLVMYTDKRSTWDGLKSDFDRLKEILTGKYGKPTNEYAFFAKPYEEGDGYEMTAVVNEKSHYSAYWFGLSGYNVSISIEKWKQVAVAYENDYGMSLRKQEQDAKLKQVF